MDQVAAAGFSGIEPEVCMLGRYRTEPAHFHEALDSRRLRLGALCLVCDWREEHETAAERAEADRVIAYLKHFPGTVLALCHMPGKDRNHWQDRQEHCIACIHDVARRATASGISTAFHPNSPSGSVFRTEDDYKRLLDAMDTRILGFAPDAGHIARGGMDPVSIFRHYQPLIRHVHFKDMTSDGAWALMGMGVIDFPHIVTDLQSAGYNGWIMVEDESRLAETDPDAATCRNGQYVSALTTGR